MHSEKSLHFEKSDLICGISEIIRQLTDEQFITPDQHIPVSTAHRLFQRLGLMTPKG